MTTKTPDLTVNGSGSPVSLKKFLNNHQITDLTILVDGSGGGVLNDDPNTITMGPKERSEQAEYYRESFFKKEEVPATYLYRYLSYMFIEDNGADMKYPTDKDTHDAIARGEITADSEDYKQVINLIKYSDTNAEAAQIIGMVIGLGGLMRSASKLRKAFRVLIETPEYALHPKRQSKWISMLNNLRREYEDTNQSINP